MSIQLECTCTDISIYEWNRLMKGCKKASYKKLVKQIKEELPDLYYNLALSFYNPWEGHTKQTKTHYILVHSAIEYFITK